MMPFRPQVRRFPDCAGISGNSPSFPGILVTYLIPSLHQLKGNSRALNRLLMD
jgi:hypothetical protein